MYIAPCFVLLFTDLCTEGELPDPKFASVMQILFIQRGKKKYSLKSNQRMDDE